MIIAYVKMSLSNKNILGVQKMFVDKMVQDGWTHLGYTKIKSSLWADEEEVVALLAHNFSLKDGIGNVDELDKLEIELGNVVKGNSGIGPRYIDKTIRVRVPICPKCGSELSEETDADARTMCHLKCKCGYAY